MVWLIVLGVVLVVAGLVMRDWSEPGDVLVLAGRPVGPLWAWAATASVLGAIVLTVGVFAGG